MRKVERPRQTTPPQKKKVKGPSVPRATPLTQLLLLVWLMHYNCNIHSRQEPHSTHTRAELDVEAHGNIPKYTSAKISQWEKQRVREKERDGGKEGGSPPSDSHWKGKKKKNTPHWRSSPSPIKEARLSETGKCYQTLPNIIFENCPNTMTNVVNLYITAECLLTEHIFFCLRSTEG